MAIRARESSLASVTAGNGAIYAIRRKAYSAYRFDPVMGHDLAMPFQLVRAGWRAVDVDTARATEKMVPTIDGEFRRKRRMMSHAWPIVLRAGMLDLRGQPAPYSLMLVSHRWLRYGGRCSTAGSPPPRFVAPGDRGSRGCSSPGRWWCSRSPPSRRCSRAGRSAGSG